ncbi:MAG: DUF2339 domain-containing protein [Hyphomonadaceae bacterium]|nr:DUF2339 domain-containing protein [Hyphomonadaceae bacterium]
MNAPVQRIPALTARDLKRREPLLLVDVVTPGDLSAEKHGLRRLAWVGAFVAVAAPSLEIFTGGTASGLMWISMVLAIGAVFAASHFAWKPAGWFGALGAIGWAALASERWLVEPEGAWPAVFLFVIAMAGIWLIRRQPAAGSIMFTGAGLIAAYAAFGDQAAGPFGAALALAAVIAAVAGGALRKLEPATGVGWLIACVGLYVLSGQGAAQPWLMPAFVLFAAVFFAIEAIALPMLGRAGMMVAALGAISPLLAVGVLYNAGIGPTIGSGGRAGEALAFLGAGALQAGVLLLCARRLKDLKALSFAIAPVGAGLVFGLIAAAVVGLGVVWSAAALSAGAMAFARLHQYTPHRLWPMAAAALMVAAVVQACRSTWMLLHGVEGAPALAFVALALGVPALMAAFAAREGRTPAPVLHAIFEALALVFGAAALAGIVRWIGTGGVPASTFLGFAEAGAHAAIWLGGAFLLMLCPDVGARGVRRVAARTLLALGLAAATFGVYGWVNPWWGLYPAAVLGPATFNTLAIGFLAPAIAVAALAWLAQKRGAEWLSVLALCAAGALVLTWAGLEIRRDFHGAQNLGEIWGWGVFGAENVALSALLLIAALGLLRARGLLDRTERLATWGVVATIIAKVAIVDIHQPADGWRAASLVILALAVAALSVPRKARAPAKMQTPTAANEARPALWNMMRKLAASA